MERQNGEITQSVTPAHIGGTKGTLAEKWDGRDAFSIPEAAEIPRLSRGAAYQAAKIGELRVIWIGRRAIVPRRVLEKMLGA